MQKQGGLQKIGKNKTLNMQIKFSWKFEIFRVLVWKCWGEIYLSSLQTRQKGKFIVRLWYLFTRAQEWEKQIYSLTHKKVTIYFTSLINRSLIRGVMIENIRFQYYVQNTKVWRVLTKQNFLPNSIVQSENEQKRTSEIQFF